MIIVSSMYKINAIFLLTVFIKSSWTPSLTNQLHVPEKGKETY